MAIEPEETAVLTADSFRHRRASMLKEASYAEEKALLQSTVDYALQKKLDNLLSTTKEITLTVWANPEFIEQSKRDLTTMLEARGFKVLLSVGVYGLSYINIDLKF